MDKRWVRLMTQQIQIAEVELVADLGTARSTLGEILNMQGRRRAFRSTMPDSVHATVDGVPVMECSYGSLNGQYALRVRKLHDLQHTRQLMRGDDHD